MNSRVRLMVDNNELALERKINAFLEHIGPGALIDIKLAMSHEPDGGYWFSALVIYTEAAS